MPRLAPSKNVLLLTGVLLLGVAARMHGERAYSSAANFDIRLPQSVDDAERWTKILLAAVAGSLIGAALGYRLNRTTAAIMGPVGAAVATAHYSSLLGGVLGAPFGLLVAWLGPRRLVIVTAATAGAIFAGICGGAAAGANSLGPVEPVAVVTAMLLVSGAVVALNLFVTKRFPCSGEVKHWRRIAGRSTLAAITLTVAIISIPLGITLESRLWLQRLGAGSYMQLRPLDVHCFTRGLGEITAWPGIPDFPLNDLRKLRRFDRIVSFQLYGGHDSDDHLSLLPAWPGVRWLNLRESDVTDGGTAHLAALRWLQALDLSGTRVSGATFAQLPTSLMNVRLDRTAITDESLKHLAKLAWLDSLYLTDTAIGDSGIANLAGAIRLRSLDLGGTQVTDAAIAMLARNNPSLVSLDVRRTRVTSAGLAHLASLPKLWYLDLSDCAIDDDAVGALMACRGLWTLDLTGAHITPAGVARLREALPSCAIND